MASVYRIRNHIYLHYIAYFNSNCEAQRKLASQTLPDRNPHMLVRIIVSVYRKTDLNEFPGRCFKFIIKNSFASCIFGLSINYGSNFDKAIAIAALSSSILFTLVGANGWYGR